MSTLDERQHVIGPSEAIATKESRSQPKSGRHLVIASTGMVHHPPIAGGAVEAYVEDIASMFGTREGYFVSVAADYRKGYIPTAGVKPVNVFSPINRFPLRPAAGAFAHVVAGTFVATAVNRHVRSLNVTRTPIVLHLNEEVSAEILTRLLPRIPKVFTLHNPPPELNVISSTKSDQTLRRLNFRLLLRFCLPRMDSIIALSTRIRDYLCSEWNIDPSRVNVLPLPIDTEYFRPAPACADHDGELHVLFVGRLDHRKNVLSLVRALPDLRKGTRLRVVGDGPLSGEILRLSRQLGVEDRIVFFRGVTPFQLLKLYQGSSIFVLPSTLEAYPRVVIEAAACGLPVILPKLQIYQDFVQGGFVEPCGPGGDPEELAASINRLVDSPDRREELGRRARRSTVLCNSLDAVSAGLARIYGKVLE